MNGVLSFFYGSNAADLVLAGFSPVDPLSPSSDERMFMLMRTLNRKYPRVNVFVSR
jgi:hypothetical protein